MLSIAIPSRNEKFLRKTILDVLANATSEIEIFPVLDGYEPPAEEIVDDPRVHYLRIPLGDGRCHKRHGINLMVDVCHGEYVASLDAHCMVAKGFDEILARDHKPNWVQVPRRHRLDADNWCLQTQIDSRPPIDYEYIMFPLSYQSELNPPRHPREPKKREHYPAIHGFKWDKKTLERRNIPIDETMTFQGSFWFMTKDWFNKIGLMQTEGYTGWGQEAEEIGFKTWRDGGKLMVNKNTWYAHLHKGPKYGRMYHLPEESTGGSNKYSYNYWVNENREFFIKFIEKFSPVPNWPDDWQEQLSKWA